MVGFLGVFAFEIFYPERGSDVEKVDLGLLFYFLITVGIALLGAAMRRARDQANAAVEELKLADQRKNEFLAMLAHELRNPLVPIRSGLDLLAMESPPDQNNIRSMRIQVDHIVRLVDDLLDASRIMQSKIAIRTQPIELSTVVNDSVATTRAMSETRNQNVTVNLPNSKLWVSGDAVRLKQIFENLITNACKYTDNHGSIEITLSQIDNTAMFTVKDSGVGMTKQFADKAFELFSQAESTLDRSSGGLGIGLTLVRKLALLHSGSVTVHSDGLGTGSTFTVRLPLLDQTPNIEENQQTLSRLAEDLDILIVDDMRAITTVLSVLIKKLGNYDVRVANNGPDALNAIDIHRPDLVMLDIGLPEMDGYEVARRIRVHESGRSKVFLVALTGYGQEEDRRKAIESGFDLHLTKPISVDDLKRIFSDERLLSKRPGGDRWAYP